MASQITLLHGDAQQVVATLPAASVHCCVTSPPYWGQRSYAVDAAMKTYEIGQETGITEYIANLVAVLREVRRVLREDGTLWLNLGDAYAHDDKWGGTTGGKHRRDLHGTPVGRGKTRAGLKSKNLCGLPWRVAWALQEDGADNSQHAREMQGLIQAITASYASREAWPDRIRAAVERLERERDAAQSGGWYLRSDVIWAKPNARPESVLDRPTLTHEHIFLLTKSAQYFYDYEAVKEPARASQSTRNLRSVWEARDEWRAAQCVNADDAGHCDPECSVCAGQGWVWTRFLRDTPGGSVWYVSTRPYRGAHFATMPPALVKLCVQAGTSARGVCPHCGAQWERVVERVAGKSRHCPKTDALYQAQQAGRGQEQVKRTGTIGMSGGGRVDGYTVTRGWQPACDCPAHETIPATILDPFNGAGTTGVVARRYGQNYIGIDLSTEYLELSRARLQRVTQQPVLFNPARQPQSAQLHFNMG